MFDFFRHRLQLPARRVLLWDRAPQDQVFDVDALDSPLAADRIDEEQYYMKGVLRIATTHQANGQIRDREVRLIGSSGEQLGIMSAAEAQSIANAQGLDLVKISPQAVPPVCKLMDYGKFRYEQGKRAKESKKNQHTVEIKEIRLSSNIDTGDFNTKVKNALKFLQDGNRVKASIRFRGRELAHTDLGRDVLLRFANACAEYASADKSPKLEGRNMSVMLMPKVGKQGAKQ